MREEPGRKIEPAIAIRPEGTTAMELASLFSLKAIVLSPWRPDDSSAGSLPAVEASLTGRPRPSV
jgi:hypothetical protein